MNGPYYFEIQADDLDRASHFYTTVFGWKFTKAEGLPVEYWRIQTAISNGSESIRGGLLKRPGPVPQSPAGTNAYVCSMQVENFDATSQKILSLGGIVALQKFAVRGLCWQGYFIDTEGNTFGIYQPDEKAK